MLDRQASALVREAAGWSGDAIATACWCGVTDKVLWAALARPRRMKAAPCF